MSDFGGIKESKNDVKKGVMAKIKFLLNFKIYLLLRPKAVNKWSRLGCYLRAANTKRINRRQKKITFDVNPGSYFNRALRSTFIWHMECHCERDLRMSIMTWASLFGAFRDPPMILYPSDARYWSRAPYNWLKSDLFGKLLLPNLRFYTRWSVAGTSSARGAALAWTPWGATS